MKSRFFGVVSVFLGVIAWNGTHALGDEPGGGRESHGGFRDQVSRELLLRATDELIETLGPGKHRNVEVLRGMEGRRDLLIDVLDFYHLDIRFDEQYGTRKFKNGTTQPLERDYDDTPGKERIILYASFLDAFAGATTGASLEWVREIQKRLLWESAHIWGYSDLFARQFATEVLKNLFEYDDPGVYSFTSDPVCETEYGMKSARSIFECEQYALSFLKSNPLLEKVDFTFRSPHEMAGPLEQKSTIHRRDLARPVADPELKEQKSREEWLKGLDGFDQIPEGEALPYKDLTYFMDRFLDMKSALGVSRICLIVVHYTSDLSGLHEQEEYPKGTYQKCRARVNELLHLRTQAKWVFFKYIESKGSELKEMSRWAEHR